MAYYRGFLGVVQGVRVFRIFEQAVFISTRDTQKKKTRSNKNSARESHLNRTFLSVSLSCLSREVFKCTDFSSHMVDFETSRGTHVCGGKEMP